MLAYCSHHNYVIMLKLKCTKNNFFWGSVPTPAGEVTALLQTP